LNLGRDTAFLAKDFLDFLLVHLDNGLVAKLFGNNFRSPFQLISYPAIRRCVVCTRLASLNTPLPHTKLLRGFLLTIVADADS
jgi:hypothetical protein